MTAVEALNGHIEGELATPLSGQSETEPGRAGRGCR
jgi:hypothetical protein